MCLIFREMALMIPETSLTKDQYCLFNFNDTEGCIFCHQGYGLGLDGVCKTISFLQKIPHCHSHYFDFEQNLYCHACEVQHVFSKKRNECVHSNSIFALKETKISNCLVHSYKDPTRNIAKLNFAKPSCLVCKENYGAVESGEKCGEIKDYKSCRQFLGIRCIRKGNRYLYDGLKFLELPKNEKLENKKILFKFRPRLDGIYEDSDEEYISDNEDSLKNNNDRSFDTNRSDDFSGEDRKSKEMNDSYNETTSDKELEDITDEMNRIELKSFSSSDSDNNSRKGPTKRRAN